MQWNDERLEKVHTYIQWLFPLDEPSQAQPSSPVLTNSDREVFLHDESIRQRMRQSLDRMLQFYGLYWLTLDGNRVVDLSPEWGSRCGHWLRHDNHNFLRLTRILRSLRLLGFGEEAKALQTCLLDLRRSFPHIIGSRAARFWESAV